MTRPTARVLALLEVLQAGGTHRVGDLAARLGVDERTVRRYAVHLVDLDIPVESVRGRYGGYRLAPGFRMPPLMLTDDEALAVLLGLLTGSPGTTVTGSRQAAESAAAKVRRVLPRSLAARFDALFAAVEFTAARSDGDVPRAETLLRLAEAAGARRTVRLDYRDREGNRTDRTVQPYGVVAHRDHWYVTGQDSIRGEVRRFRVDRIASAQLLGEQFDAPETFDPVDDVLTGLVDAPYQHTVCVLVPATTVEQVRPALPRTVARVEPAHDVAGAVRVTIRAQRLEWIPALLARMDLPFVVEAPDELREHVRTVAVRLTAAISPT